MLFQSLLKKFKPNSQLPNSRVLFAFSSRYPEARQIQWKQIDVFKWQVSFRAKGITNWSLFNNEGTWLETIHSVSLKDIPLMVQENYGSKYGIEELQHIYKIQMSLRTIFEVHWGNGIYNLKLLYDENGKMIGKIMS